jgi:hypothetical protein
MYQFSRFIPLTYLIEVVGASASNNDFGGGELRKGRSSLIVGGHFALGRWRHRHRGHRKEEYGRDQE